jgi:ATP synthase protein I
MSDRPPQHKTGTAREHMRDEVQRSAVRKQRSRAQPRRSAWFGLGMFGLVGWSVAIPTLIGVALGLWLDRRWPSEASWTLTFLFLGVVLGCLNAWYWIRQESDRDD